MPEKLDMQVTQVLKLQQKRGEKREIEEQEGVQRNNQGEVRQSNNATM